MARNARAILARFWLGNTYVLQTYIMLKATVALRTCVNVQLRIGRVLEKQLNIILSNYIYMYIYSNMYMNIYIYIYIRNQNPTSGRLYTRSYRIHFFFRLLDFLFVQCLSHQQVFLLMDTRTQLSDDVHPFMVGEQH